MTDTAPYVMGSEKLFDSRWKGNHGIGRFASEVSRRLADFQNISLGGLPSAPYDPFILWDYLRRKAPRLFFSPGYNAPAGCPCPFIFCLHDLNHIAVPESSTAFKRAYYRHIILPAIHRAEAVLTVSEFSRSAICEWARVEEDKVINVGNGVSQAFRPDGLSHDQNGRPYFLYVGNHKAHKNLPRMLRAFAACSVDSDFMLLITGTASRDLSQIVADLGLEDRVAFVGLPSEEKLAALYRGAVALLLVSTYEGFGLPIAEAMASGTPVVTSSMASMPEIAGDAALFVDPADVDAIADALTTIASDESLRRSLRERGLSRVKSYSWDETAGKILGVLTACSSRDSEGP